MVRLASDDVSELRDRRVQGSTHTDTAFGANSKRNGVMSVPTQRRILDLGELSDAAMQDSGVRSTQLAILIAVATFERGRKTGIQYTDKVYRVAALPVAGPWNFTNYGPARPLGVTANPRFE